MWARKPHPRQKGRIMADIRSALVKTLRQNMAFAIAIAMLASLYLVYNFMHPRGFSAAVLIQNSNESVAISFSPWRRQFRCSWAGWICRSAPS